MCAGSARRELGSLLWADPHRGGDAGLTNRRDSLTEQVRIDRCRMEFLQLAHCRCRIDLVLSDPHHLGDLGLDIAVASPETFTVEDTETPVPTQFDSRLRGDERVRGVTQDRDLEPVGIELPRGRHLFRRAGAPRSPRC